MSLTQLVPEFQQTFHVPDLGNTLAIPRIRLGPERGGTEVAVLTENVDSFFGNQIRHEIDHCLSCYRVAEVEQPPLHERPFKVSSEFASFFSDKPFWMFDGERRTDNRPFRLKPKQVLHALGMCCLAYRSHALWMRNPVDAPVPSVQEPILFPEYLEFSHGSIRTVPSRIHPEALKAEVLFRYLIDQVQAGRGLHSAPPHVGYGQNNWIPVVLRRVVLQDVTTQDVVSIDIIAFPGQEEDKWCPDLLAGMKRKMRICHSGPDVDGCLVWAREGDGPFPGPSYGADQSATIHANVEKRNRLARFASTVIRHTKVFQLIEAPPLQRIRVHPDGAS